MMQIARLHVFNIVPFIIEDSSVLGLAQFLGLIIPLKLKGAASN